MKSILLFLGTTALVGAASWQTDLEQAKQLSAAGQTTAWSLLVHGATLAVVGFTLDKVEVRLSNLMAFHARALGNWGCPPELYPAALDLVLDGRIKVAPFVEHHPLADINQVFADVHARKLTRRAILIP